jgi:uncharacterized protein
MNVAQVIDSYVHRQTRQGLARSFDTKELRYLACKDRRDLPLELADLKFTDQKAAEDPLEFEGYASVWGRVDSYGDTIVKGAFSKSLAERRPMMLFGHNPGRVPGKWVKYQEDDKGLLVRGALTPGNSEARDHGANLKFGALNGLSIGGYSVDWENQKTGGRIIREFDLYEISIVSMPAEQEARVDTASVKQMLDECEKLSDFEAFLREAAGLSKSAATSMVARFQRIARGEPASEAESKQIGEFLDLLKSPLPALESHK